MAERESKGNQPHGDEIRSDKATDAWPPEQPQQAAVAIPYARVIEEPEGPRRSLRLAYVLIFVLLLGLCAWIGWLWWEDRGLPITIEFEHPPRHLEKGAPLTLNGVQVGEVKAINLLENQIVQIEARLTSSPQINRTIAREGTMFWIPKFRVDLTRGIENVESVFASEIAIRPGTGPPQYDFSGLAYEPPNVWVGKGELPIVLRSPANYGIEEGSSVLYRGLEIGAIVRTQLSRDSRQFEAWLRIFPEYRHLVRTNSHFVDGSGLDLEVGLIGMSLNIESLESILRGSVLLFTPPDHGPPVAPGREFELELEVVDEYREWAPYLEYEDYQPMYEPNDDAAAPHLLKARLTWQSSPYWGWLGGASGESQGLFVAADAGLIAPLNLLMPPTDDAEDPLLSFNGRRVQMTPDLIAWQGNGLGVLQLGEFGGNRSSLALRHPTEAESCTIHGPGGMKLMLDREYLTADGDVWRVQGSTALNAGWNGAAVISSRDGALLGLLVMEENERPAVHPLPADFPFIAD